MERSVIKKQPKPDKIGQPAKEAGKLTFLGTKAFSTGIMSIISFFLGTERSRIVTTKSIDSCSRSMDSLVAGSERMKEDLKAMKAYRLYKEAFSFVEQRMDVKWSQLEELQKDIEAMKAEHDDKTHEMHRAQEPKKVKALKERVEWLRFSIDDQQENLREARKEYEALKEALIELTWEDFLGMDSAAHYKGFWNMDNVEDVEIIEELAHEEEDISKEEVLDESLVDDMGEEVDLLGSIARTMDEKGYLIPGFDEKSYLTYDEDDNPHIDVEGLEKALKDLKELSYEDEMFKTLIHTAELILMTVKTDIETKAIRSQRTQKEDTPEQSIDQAVGEEKEELEEAKS